VSGADRSIEDIVAERQITRVVHFTTNPGLVGVTDAKAVHSRATLDEQERLSGISFPVWRDRGKDIDWVGHVNLSLSVVNDELLNYSRIRHQGSDVWWLVLAFDPVILSHPGVVFTTTNNTHPPVLRAEGADGLEAMFAPRVRWGKYGSVKTRTTSTPDWQTTCLQAEVLYPGSVSLEYLKEIIVPEPERLDDVAGIFAALNVPLPATLTCDPDVFK
jgi:hypothetical protein